MNKGKFKQYLLKKGELWQSVFMIMYLRRFGLLPTDLKDRPFDAVSCLKYCRNVDDLDELWDLAEEIDENYQAIESGLDTIRYGRPIPWQYDFIDVISEFCNVKIVQTLGFGALVTAYCWAYSEPGDVLNAMFNLMDERYEKIIKGLTEKQIKLKRNMLLTLECLYGQKVHAPIQEIPFRQILDDYLSVAGHRGVLKVLKAGSTPDTELTEKEKKCLMFAYYSPYWDDSVNLVRGVLPQSSLFSQVHEIMHEMYGLWVSEQEQSLKDTEFDALKRVAIYADTLEGCIVDVHMDKIFYANVYIKRLPVDSICNDYPDFLVYFRKFLYTVEFVDDFSECPATRKFEKEVDSCRQSLQDINEKLDRMSPEPSAERTKYLKHRQELLRFLDSCYHIVM